MPCHTHCICVVSRHREFCCAQQGDVIVKIVCYKQYIQTVSLQNEFVCVLLSPDCF